MLLFLISVTTGIVLWGLLSPVSSAESEDDPRLRVVPLAMEFPRESGDLGVLRLVLDGPVRVDVDAAAAPDVPIGTRVRSLARVLLEHRGAWRSAGAIDVDAGRLFDVPERYAPLLAAERERIAILDDWRAPAGGPFRSPGDLDPREVVVVVFVLGVRESPVLRYFQKDTLVTIGEIRRGDSVAEALATLAVLPDESILTGEVFVHHAHAGDLFRAYSRTDLVALRA